MTKIGAEVSYNDASTRLKINNNSGGFDRVILKDLTLGLSSQIMKNGTLPMPESRNGKLHYRIEIGVCSVEELGKLNYMKRELKLYKEFASSYASLVERAILEEDIAQLLG